MKSGLVQICESGVDILSSHNKEEDNKTIEEKGEEDMAEQILDVTAKGVSQMVEDEAIKPEEEEEE